MNIESAKYVVDARGNPESVQIAHDGGKTSWVPIGETSWISGELNAWVAEGNTIAPADPQGA